MRTRILPRSAPLVALAAAASLPFAIAIAACGGKSPSTLTPGNASASASTAAMTASATTATATGTSSATPPTSAMPTASQPSRYTSKVATRKHSPDWKSCYAAYQAKTAGKDLAADVTTQARMCAEATGMHQLMVTGTNVTKGTMMAMKQSDQDVPKKWDFPVKSGKCYRAFADSTPWDKTSNKGVKDLDLVIKDSEGNLAGEDGRSLDASPTVEEDGAVCFSADGTATVAATIGAGSGDFAIQVWTNE